MSNGNTIAKQLLAAGNELAEEMQHHLTAAEDEMDFCLSQGWEDEAAEWEAYTEMDALRDALQVADEGKGENRRLWNQAKAAAIATGEAVEVSQAVVDRTVSVGDKGYWFKRSGKYYARRE